MDCDDYRFTCPYCEVDLSESGEIVLSTKRSEGETGTLFLAKKIGNYNYRHTPKVNFGKLELVELFCPICSKNIASDQYEDHALLHLHVGENVKLEVLFSRRAGQGITYIVTQDGIETFNSKPE